MVIGIVMVVVLIGVIVALLIYVDNNRNGEARLIEKAYASGYVEKQVEIDDAIINYAEGPDHGPALLLIHGQSMAWEDYARVLPALAKTYHVFAIDCFGHGESTHDPSLYTCETQGKACLSFAREVIGGDYLVSGLSSGGIIAAWIAANDTEKVQACLLEDPPLFRVTPEQMQENPGTFVWRDGFEVIHAYLEQETIDDLAIYYAQHSYLFSMFGGLQNKIAEWTEQERAKAPDSHLTLAWVPHDWVRGMYYYDDFDPQFSEAFYQGTWLSEIDQEQTLHAIECPTVYLKAETRYGEDGTLFAANTDLDAARVKDSILKCEIITIQSGHDIHYERPAVWIDALDRVGAQI